MSGIIFLCSIRQLLFFSLNVSNIMVPIICHYSLSMITYPIVTDSVEKPEMKYLKTMIETFPDDYLSIVKRAVQMLRQSDLLLT